MTIDQLREAVRQEPFQPFVVSLADGRRFNVPHPEFVFIPPKASRTFVVVTGDEVYSIVDLLMVTSIDFENGQSNKRRAKRRE